MSEPRTLTKEEAEAFLAELTELSRRTGVAIESCTCCSSMWLVALTDEQRKDPRGYVGVGGDSAIGWAAL
jgi:hypothetical protein